MATKSKVKPCVIAPSQFSRMVRGEPFIYHVRAKTKAGGYLNRPACGRQKLQCILISYSRLHGANGIAKMCHFCRNRCG